MGVSIASIETESERKTERERQRQRQRQRERESERERERERESRGPAALRVPAEPCFALGAGLRGRIWVLSIPLLMDIRVFRVWVSLCSSSGYMALCCFVFWCCTGLAGA